MILELPHCSLVEVVLWILIYRERLDSLDVHVVLCCGQLWPQEVQFRSLFFLIINLVYVHACFLRPMILSLSHNKCTNVIASLRGPARVGSAIFIGWVDWGQLQPRIFKDLLRDFLVLIPPALSFKFQELLVFIIERVNALLATLNPPMSILGLLPKRVTANNYIPKTLLVGFPLCLSDLLELFHRDPFRRWIRGLSHYVIILTIIWGRSINFHLIVFIFLEWGDFLEESHFPDANVSLVCMKLPLILYVVIEFVEHAIEWLGICLFKLGLTGVLLEILRLIATVILGLLIETHCRVIVLCYSATVDTEEWAVVAGSPFDLRETRISPLFHDHIVYLRGFDVHKSELGFELHLLELVFCQLLGDDINWHRHCNYYSD